MGFVEVASVNDLDDGQMVAFEADGNRILLAKVDGEFFAISAICSHERSNLDQGSLLGHVVYCPLHYSAFDIRSGAVLGPPAECGVPAHEVRVEDGRVLVSTEPLGSAAPVPTAAAPPDTAAAPVEAAAAPVEAAAAPVEMAAAPVEMAAAPVETAAVPVDTAAAAVETAATPVATAPLPLETAGPVAPAVDAGAPPLDTSARARVEQLISQIESNLNELRSLIASGTPPVDPGAAPPPALPPEPGPSEPSPPEGEARGAVPAGAPTLDRGAVPPPAARATEAAPQAVAGAWSLQPPRFMGRITTSARSLPVAIAIPAAIVTLLVLIASVLLRDGPAVPDGDILFEHFIGHGWLDVFTLSLVGVAALLAASGLRRFWKGLHATLPPGLPLQPLSGALRDTAEELLTHEDFHDWTTSDVQRRSHLAMFYGFLGLMAATTGAALYTEIFPIFGIEWHRNELSLPIWDPVKIVGNVGGIALLVGLTQTLSIWRRRPRTATEATYSEWFFPVSLVLAAVTGFLTEILRFAGVRLAYGAYSVHLVFVFALFVFFPFSKFAHVIYHPAARTFGRQLRRRKRAPKLVPAASSLK